MAAARKLQNGGKEEETNDELILEEAVLSLVITNAVEVQDGSGRSLGIAVYDTSFSWINHSCSPNACYRFSISPPNAVPSAEDSTSKLRIVPSVSGEECDVCRCLEHTKGNRGYQYGPKIIVRSIKRISKGEEVCISYTDLLQPKAMRQSELWSKYQFTCSCSRCSATPSTYIDRALEEISSIDLGLSSSSFDVKLYRDETTKRCNTPSVSLRIFFDCICCKFLDKCRGVFINLSKKLPVELAYKGGLPYLRSVNNCKA
ncbi:hypothetical protein CCACVL1_00035 [Corchorus capsularis]|uniref:SET domain-containing protein n=1 Tax=Corchorus capsularis TaxID=210143 RepID=A0A1R3KZ70_COCAP|nr:hypothetical protein CCACVL1_00035 [Corchorus capsularis]